MAILKSILAGLLFLTPRFVTYEVVYEHSKDTGQWEPVCDVSEIEPGETYEKVGTVNGFEWLWFGFDYREEYPLRDFDNRGSNGNSDL
jgi:hypothetical protein